METRHLAIDWNLDHPAIHRDPFFGRFSFSAFDAVFIDPEPISRHWTAEVATGGDGIRRTDPERDRGFGRTLKAWMQRRRAEADDLLKRGGGIIVCRLRPRGEPLEILSSGGVPERVDRYSWLPSITLVDRHHQLSFPTNGRFLPRRGEDIVLAGTGSPFEDYLREFEGHIVYDAVYQDLLSTPIERFATVLARNRVGDIVALEIPFDEGRLILVARKEAFRPAFAPIPDWLPSYPLPGEDELVDELTGLTERRDALALKVEETAKKLEEKTRYKLLLYAKGRFSFLPAVADSFRALGFDVTESGPELVLQSPEGDAIVAAEARSGDHRRGGTAQGDTSRQRFEGARPEAPADRIRSRGPPRMRGAGDMPSHLVSTVQARPAGAERAPEQEVPRRSSPADPRVRRGAEGR